MALAAVESHAEAVWEAAEAVEADSEISDGE